MPTKASPAVITDPELVAAAMPEQTGPMWISPEIAELWLTRNTANRPIRATRVNTMARDMAVGQWIYTGESIKFAADGRLLDGQHRLMAIIKSGETVKMLVVTGLEGSSQQYMDAGARRTAADALSLRGEAHSSVLSSTVRFAINIQRGQSVKHDGVSHAEIIDWVTRNPEIRRYVGKASRYCSKYDLKPSTMGYALWKMYSRDEDDAETFLMDLIEMRTDGPGDPIHALIARLRSAKRNREYLSNHVELNFIARAWNARRLGQALRILKYPVNELDIVKFR